MVQALSPEVWGKIFLANTYLNFFFFMWYFYLHATFCTCVCDPCACACMLMCLSVYLCAHLPAGLPQMCALCGWMYVWQNYNSVFEISVYFFVHQWCYFRNWIFTSPILIKNLLLLCFSYIRYKVNYLRSCCI